jgi:hypothetical protein
VGGFGVHLHDRPIDGGASPPIPGLFILVSWKGPPEEGSSRTVQVGDMRLCRRFDGGGMPNEPCVTGSRFGFRVDLSPAEATEGTSRFRVRSRSAHLLAPQDFKVC